MIITDVLTTFSDQSLEESYQSRDLVRLLAGGDLGACSAGGDVGRVFGVFFRGVLLCQSALGGLR